MQKSSLTSLRRSQQVQGCATAGMQHKLLFWSKLGKNEVLLARRTSLQHQSNSPSQGIIILLGMLLSFHYKSSHCANDFVPQSFEDATAVTVATPVSSHWTASQHVLDARFEKECSAWRNSPLLLNGSEQDGAVVFGFGVRFSGLGNKFRIMRSNFFISLLLKKRFLIQGIEGVDIGLYFEPSRYNWILPPGMNSTDQKFPFFECLDLATHMRERNALPLFISLKGCSAIEGALDIGKIVRSRSDLSAGFVDQVMKLWETRHCFLQTMFRVTDRVYSSLPHEFFLANERIGFHVRWGDFYLKSVQRDSDLVEEKRVTEDAVVSCLKKLCKPTTPGILPLGQKSAYIYMASDMPRKLYSVYRKMYKFGNASEWTCLSNVHRLPRSISYHTGRHTALASIDSIFLPAIADFVALSRSQIIVAPMESTFSMEAASFGLQKLERAC